jgi:hypothetical protein
MQVVYQKVVEALLKHGVLFVYMTALTILMWQKIIAIENKYDSCNAKFQDYMEAHIDKQNKIIEHNTEVLEEVLREIRKK